MSVQPTFIKWYNAESGSKVATADVGPYEDIPYGSAQPGAKHARDKPPHPEFGQWQWGLACSRTSRTIIIDIDHPDKWREGNTYVDLGDWEDIATSYREDGERAHVAVEVPEELLPLWPRQGPTVWGDIKSAGFSYEEGVHFTGMLYRLTGRPWLVATAELLAALTADRIFPQGKGATGVMAGPWEQEGYEITSHDECVATVMSMTAAGLSPEDVYARLEVIMPNREGDWPDRDAYIHEKISSARRKITERDDKTYQWADDFSRVHSGKPWAEYAAEAEAQQREELEKAYATPEAERLGEITAFRITFGNDQWLATQAHRLMRAMGYAYAADTGAYFRRVGDHWERCPEDPCPSIVARMADLVPRPKDANWDGKDITDKNDPELLEKKLYSYLHMSSSSSRVVAKLRAVLPNEPEQNRLRETDMDTNGRVFWAGGTPYDLRTLEIADVSPDVPHLLTAGYIPATGETPLWDELNAAQWPDEELREYALNVLSSVLRGGNKLLPNFKSDGNMGKTTRLMMLVDLLGTYAEQLPVQLLTGRTGHDESFLRLKGKRLVWMDETPPASKVATEKLKNLSGGGQLTGRAMFGRAPVAFSMQHTLLLAGNDDLPLTDENVAMIRVRYLPIIGDKTRIRTASQKIWDGHGGLSDAWRKEAPAVLWEIMQRASRVMARPDLTNMPAEALSPLADAIIEQDHIAQFVRECCETGKGKTAAGLIRETYVAWCQRNAAPIETSSKFGQQLTKMGYPANKSSATRDRPLSLRPFLAF